MITGVFVNHCAETLFNRSYFLNEYSVYDIRPLNVANGYFHSNGLILMLCVISS